MTKTHNKKDIKTSNNILVDENQSNKKNIFINIWKLLIISWLISFFVWLLFIRVWGPIAMLPGLLPYLLIIWFIFRIIWLLKNSKSKKKLG